MGLIFSVFFLACVIYGLRWVIKQVKNEQLTSMPAEAQAHLGERREERRNRYARRHNSPRVHPSVFKSFWPYGLIITAPLVLTAVIAREPIAFILMAVGCGAFALLVFFYFNREAQALYNQEQDSEDYVALSMAGLDDFTVPEDWARKYL